MSPDTRRHSERTGRLDLSAAIEPADARSYGAAIQNLGPDGASLRADTPVQQGDRIRVRFQLENHPLPFDIEADVRWERGEEGFGVQFVHACAYDRAALADFCQLRLDDRRRRRLLNQGS